MGVLLRKLVYPRQVAYIKGRSIYEQVLFASVLVNEMKVKKRGGNMGLKMDTSHAYDLVSWEFLFVVLQKYGFSSA